MNNHPRVITVGSINIDLIVRATRRPLPGETFPGESFVVYPGGKGLNQAVQAALSGVESVLVARMGDDIFAPPIRALLAQVGVDIRYVQADPRGTGIGHVLIDAEGDYSTVIVAAANAALAPTDVDAARQLIADSTIMQLQLEVPIDTVTRAATLAHRSGVRVVLNAAPALPVPEALLDSVDVLVVNEVEAGMLAQTTLHPQDEAQVDAVLRQLSAGRRDVVLTLGPRGMAAIRRDGQVARVGGIPVAVVNTIGAGDAFIGELSARLAMGNDLFAALPYANATGALATTSAEPQSTAIYSQERIQTLLDRTLPGSTAKKGGS